MKSIKGFWKHIENGRIYAIESTLYGDLLGAAGPLDPNHLPDLESLDYRQDILIWVETTISECKLRRFNQNPLGTSVSTSAQKY